MEQSSAHQPQELMPQKSGEVEDRLAVALSDVRIAEGELEHCKGTLKQIMVKVGLRAANWPEDEEKAVLISHIIGQYGNHTHQELLLAFDMAISGQLGVEANCYENFSCLYFSGIMNAYREWSAEAHKHITKDQFKALPAPKEDISDQAMEDWLNHTREAKTALEFMPLMLYDWVLKKELIAPTKELKWKYWEKAIAFHQSKLAKACDELMNAENRAALVEFNEMKVSNMFTVQAAKELRNLSKKMILYDYINF